MSRRKPFISGRKLYALALLLACLPALGRITHAQTTDRAKAAAEIESLRAQIKEREAVLLAPSNEDKKAYAEFLAQTDTGLVRLLPREQWDHKLSTNGGGAYYSFARLTHEYGYGSDISLEQGYFQPGGFGGASFGFIVDLGNVPLENLTEETDGVKFLSEYYPPSAEKEARAAYMSIGQGVHSGEWIYKSRETAEAGHTYAIRSVNYDTSDVLVAFRVVRKDTDGSMVLLWKILRKYAKPTLERGVANAMP